MDMSSYHQAVWYSISATLKSVHQGHCGGDTSSSCSRSSADVMTTQTLGELPEESSSCEEFIIAATGSNIRGLLGLSQPGGLQLFKTAT
ncbi:hypothetical protein RRG08_010879 [Elysia crispata]|uniref:Uncharacterized protein n=1 Tax=Elysia crispata TaxID=231223 RepID=A0AAE0XTB6_9GAST|nr:hypothetical protein RRG08_010879 [Elysia crispata]